ncbi:uncharacterized protein PHALS_12117 [Plasmopara halstedii]|uniref:Uncharacterized protein n=1 Tax=Plasmopara halstedii TaxID=4781 RepID=A0A0P1AKZ0_PLAHL|nr:uncharacterized protein PHALS_12117 [Plasmopara halstedii]CEG41792.1 hypothetical protein PHALS_12117 [Plasmopara halstedii]|eukprot:XP_024578161.1 hypothetical protein PHALS_12117 [Plasmopara halstedii]
MVPERGSPDTSYRIRSELLFRDGEIRCRTPTHSSNCTPPQHSVRVTYPSDIDLTNIQRVSSPPGAIAATQQLCGGDLLVFGALKAAHIRPTTKKNAAKFGRCEE